jgi:hypothetical protein
MPTGTLPALGATALDASQQQRASVPGYQEDEYDRRLKGYKLSPDYQAYTAPTPNPYYRPTYAAIGGIMNSNAPHSFDDESGSDNVGMAAGGMNMAGGGIAGLGGYSDGGRMLKGPGDGMSDSIPGVIGGKQPARLADGEFVVPADVVSHLGNGSTDAGAKKLYSMMDKVRQARTGKKKQAPQVDMTKYMPMGKASGGITGYAEGGTVGYAEGGTTYSTAQVAQAIAESVAQGFSVADTVQAGIANYGISPEQAAQAVAMYSSGITSGGGGASTPTPTQTYTNQQLADAIKASIAQGFTLDQTKQGAMEKYGISSAQIAAATALYNAQNPVVPIKPIVPIVPKVPTQTYTTQQYLDFLKASMAAGNSLEAAKLDIRNKYGATDADLYAMAALYDAQNKATTTPTATTGPLSGSAVYRPGFVPRTSGVNMSPAIQDPYSNQGLQSLYGQMMGQYAKPAPQMSDAEVKALAERAYSSGSGAEVGRQLINAGIPVKQAISALKSYSGLTPEIINQAYIGGQTLGTTPPPTLNTQYNYSDPATYYKPPTQNNLILTRPIVDAAFTPSVAADTSGIGGRLAAAVDNSSGSIGN